ncbi:hypothetical protein UlMin_014322 [Ulmus minor]
MLVLIYVDDMIVTGNDSSSMQFFVEKLHKKFALKDMGSLHHFLGIEVKRDDSGMYLTQSKYIDELLRRTHMENTSPCPTPAVVGKQCRAEEGEPLQNPTIYRSTLGALQYLTNTRLDLSFIVNSLSRHLQNPTTLHWQGVKRILRYLQGTHDMGLHIRYNNDILLTGFSDADWGCNLDDRRSVAGYCVFFGDYLVSWSSKKQNVVSRSSTESEYRALSNVACEIAWIQSLLCEISFPLPMIPVTWCDNSSAGALAANPVYHARTKHVDINVHFIREKVLSKSIEVRFVPSHDQIADCLTKPLSHTRFQFL